MRHLTASEARKNWFRLLDEIVAGEVACIERHGKRILLTVQDEVAEGVAVPRYADLLQVPDADAADRWGWEWSGPGQKLIPTNDRASEKPSSFLRTAQSLDLQGPPDWSSRLEDYLYGEASQDDD